jgi:hypothetical protein
MNKIKHLDPLPLSDFSTELVANPTETPPVTLSGSPVEPEYNSIEKAFHKWSKPYTGMQLMDMEKSSHGRAFIAGWKAAMASKEQKFRKKPVEVSATQWFQHGDHYAVTKMPDWVVGYSADNGWIETLEGGHVVKFGDWIITGVQGEHYPCKSDIFEQTYEPANDA